MRTRTLIQIMSSALQARSNCLASGPKHPWTDRWHDRLEYIAKNLLPSGSGIDNGTKIDYDACKPDRVVLTAGFHHMNEGGYYDGWTEHKVTIRPAFDGVDIRISGPNRNNIKDYLHEVYSYCLTGSDYTIDKETGNPVPVE